MRGYSGLLGQTGANPVRPGLPRSIYYLGNALLRSKARARVRLKDLRSPIPLCDAGRIEHFRPPKGNPASAPRCNSEEWSSDEAGRYRCGTLWRETRKNVATAAQTARMDPTSTAAIPPAVRLGGAVGCPAAVGLKEEAHHARKTI